MNTREKILLQCETDLPNFRVQHGYELDYPNIEKGIIDLSDNNNFPLVCYDLGNDTRQQSGSVNTHQLVTTPLQIVIYVEDKNENGKIVNIREQAISDIIKFVMGDDSVTGYGTLEHKVLRLGMPNMQAMQWEVNISHETSMEDAMAKVTALVNIQYYEFAQTTPNYQNLDG